MIFIVYDIIAGDDRSWQDEHGCILYFLPLSIISTEVHWNNNYYVEATNISLPALTVTRYNCRTESMPTGITISKGNRSGPELIS